MVAPGLGPHSPSLVGRAVGVQLDDFIEWTYCDTENSGPEIRTTVRPKRRNAATLARERRLAEKPLMICGIQ